MTEKGATYPIGKKDLDKHVQKVNEHMEMIRKGKGILFVGTGLSAAAGAPSWGTLLESIADEDNLYVHILL